MNPLTVPLLIWTAATLVGTIIALLALRELRNNWIAVQHVRGRPYMRVLQNILLGNLYQQSGRVVMEALCWASIVISLFGDESSRSAILVWLLVGYRVMHTVNSLTELVANVRRRYRRTGEKE